MQRLGLWEERLAALVTDAQQRAFAWGRHDCALWACDAIQALTGTDPAADLRGTYASREEADAILEPYGGLRGLARVYAERHGFPEISPRLAQRGDVVLASFQGRDTLGVCLGATAAFPHLLGGLTYVPITAEDIVTAWAVR